MSVGERVRYYRELRKMTQEKLARAIDVPSAAMSRIEHDDRKVSLEEAARLASALGIAMTDLVEHVEIEQTQEGTNIPGNTSQQGNIQKFVQDVEQSLESIEPTQRDRTINMLRLFLDFLDSDVPSSHVEIVAHSRGITATI